MVGPFSSRCDPSPFSGQPPNIWLFPFFMPPLLLIIFDPHLTSDFCILSFETQFKLKTSDVYWVTSCISSLFLLCMNCRHGLSRTICCKQSSQNLHIYSASSDRAGGGLPDASQLRWLLAAVDAHDLMCILSDIKLPLNMWSFSRKDDKSMLTRLRFRGISVTAQGSWTDPSVSLLLWIGLLLKQNIFKILTCWLLLLHAWVVFQSTGFKM